MMERVVISTTNAPSAIGPYSQGIRAGSFIFVSGQIPLDPESGQIVYGGIKEQTRRVLESLRNILEEGGSSLNKVVKTTIFLANMDKYNDVNEVYSEFFGEIKPARSTVEVSRLPKGVGIEIEAIATI